MDTVTVNLATTEALVAKDGTRAVVTRDVPDAVIVVPGPQGPAGPMDEVWAAGPPQGAGKLRWVDPAGPREYGWNPAAQEWEPLAPAAYTDLADVDMAGLVGGMHPEWDAAAEAWRPVLALSAAGIISFDYRWDAATDGAPGEGRVQLDAADPSLATAVLIHARDGNGTDLTPVFELVLGTGEWCNIYSRADPGAANYRYGLTGPGARTGDVWEFPVALHEIRGALSGNEQVRLLLRFVQADTGPAIHNELADRDAADAHPQSAITGLADSLAGKVPYAYVDQVVTVSTEAPVAPPARDGLLWIVVGE